MAGACPTNGRLQSPEQTVCTLSVQNISPGQKWKWVSGSWVTVRDPLTHDDEISDH